MSMIEDSQIDELKWLIKNTTEVLSSRVEQDAKTLIQNKKNMRKYITRNLPVIIK